MTCRYVGEGDGRVVGSLEGGRERRLEKSLNVVLGDLQPDPSMRRESWVRGFRAPDRRGILCFSWCWRVVWSLDFDALEKAGRTVSSIDAIVVSLYISKGHRTE